MAETSSAKLKAPVVGRSFTVSLDNRKRRGLGHERADEILVAARELFLEFGVDKVTTRQIAAKVGISQTALYVYFSTKEEMLDKLAERAWRALERAIDDAVAGAVDPLGRLAALLSAYMRHSLLHPDDFRIVFVRKMMRGCKPDGDPMWSLTGNPLLARLTGLVDKALEAGAIRCVGGCRSTALTVWATASGMISLRLRYPESPWPPIEENIAATLELIFRGCLPREAESAELSGSAR